MACAVTTGFGVGIGATRRWALHKQEYHQTIDPEHHNKSYLTYHC